MHGGRIERRAGRPHPPARAVALAFVEEADGGVVLCHPAVSLSLGLQDPSRPVQPRIASSWFRRFASWFAGAPPFSALAIPQRRFPSRLPGPCCAVILTWIAFVSTTSPSRSRWIGPSVRSRMVQAPVVPATAVLVVALIVWVTVAPRLFVPVQIPVSVPFA